MANNKFLEYESLLTNMEKDMMQIQKAWSKGQDQPSKIDTRDVGTISESSESKHTSTQTAILTKSEEMQTDPYTCCLEKKDTREAEVQTISSIKQLGSEEELPSKGEKMEQVEKRQTEKIVYTKKIKEQKEETMEKDSSFEKEERKSTEDTEKGTSLLREQLNQALKLATERSSAIIKHELQITEYQRKVDLLNKTIEKKDQQLMQKEKLLEEHKLSAQLQPSSVDCSDKLALKSTVNSLQKLLSQKEETIARYQTLLKEDRDEHSKAAARLQEEIKSLYSRIQSMQNGSPRSVQEKDAVQPEKLTDKANGVVAKIDVRRNALQSEEVARLNERVSTLEADLNITKELSDRWHRLAEERLKHMDRMRER